MADELGSARGTPKGVRREKKTLGGAPEANLGVPSEGKNSFYRLTTYRHCPLCGGGWGGWGASPPYVPPDRHGGPIRYRAIRADQSQSIELSSIIAQGLVIRRCVAEIAFLKFLTVLLWICPVSVNCDN